MEDFDKVYSQYFSDVYKYALSLCMDESFAEEITQETFFKAMQNIKKFNGTCKLYVWLCQIAKNTYFTLYKKKKRFSNILDANKMDLTQNLEINYIDKEASKQLHIYLHNLKDPYKEVFTLRVFGELPFSQIGDLFGKTDSWARLIFYRAKKQLQEVIK